VSSSIITSVILGIAFSVLLALSSGLFAQFFSMPELQGLLIALSPIFPFSLITGVLLGLLNGIREMKRFAAAMILQGVIMITMSITLIVYGSGIIGAIHAFVLSYMGSCLFLLLTTRRYYKIDLKGYISTTKELLRFGVQVIAVNLINQINNELDILFIGFFLISADVGVYSIAVYASRFFWIIPQSIQQITFPATSSYWSENNHAALNTMLDKSMKYCMITLILIALGITFFIADVITFVFRSDFTQAILPLQILLVGTVIRGGIIQPIGGSLTAIGKPHLLIRVALITIALNVLLDIILIPGLGIVGAAIAASLSLIGGTVVNMALAVKHLSAPFDSGWYTKIGITGILIIATYQIGSEFINHLLVGSFLLGCYFIVIFIFLLNTDDKKIIRHLIGDVFQSTSQDK
jgi:stage V sporulation protein B